MPLDLILLKSISQKFGISEMNVIHEYIELEWLYTISTNYMLGRNLVLKGGTALRLVYLSDRYSDDLDFDLTSDVDPKVILKALESVARKLNYDITDQWIKRNTILFEISYKSGYKKIKIEISKLSVKTEFQTVIRNIVNQIFPYSMNINTYSLEVLMAGKIAAVLGRKRAAPRDIYDLFYFLSQNVEFDQEYLRSASSIHFLNKIDTYQKILKAIDKYPQLQIKNELNILLPKDKRDWVVKNIKIRLKELIIIKINQLISRQSET